MLGEFLFRLGMRFIGKIISTVPLQIDVDSVSPRLLRGCRCEEIVGNPHVLGKTCASNVEGLLISILPAW